MRAILANIILCVASVGYASSGAAQLDAANQYTPEWTGLRSWSGSISEGTQLCNEAAVNTSWRDGEVRVQEVRTSDPYSLSRCGTGSHAWAHIAVPAEAVPPGVPRAERPMPGLQSSAPALSGNWLFVAFLTYSRAPDGLTSATSAEQGRWNLYARFHDPDSDYCSGWDSDWIQLGEVRSAPSAVTHAGETLVIAARYNPGELVPRADDPGTTQQSTGEYRSWLGHSDGTIEASAPFPGGLGGGAVQDYASGRPGVAVADDKLFVTINQNANGGTNQFFYVLAFSLDIFAGNIPRQLGYRPIAVSTGRPVTSVALRRYGDSVVAVTGTDSGTDLHSEIVDPIGPYVPFIITFDDFRSTFAVSELAPITIEESTGSAATLPSHAQPVLGRTIGRSAVLYHYSQWDDAVIKVMVPLDPIGSGVTSSYADNYFVPFSQQWDYQVDTSACFAQTPPNFFGY